MTSTYGASDVVAPSAATGPDDFDRLEFTSDDVGESRGFLERVYSGRQFRARRVDESFAFRFASAGTARLTLETGFFLGHLQGVIPWSRDYVVSWFRMGSVAIDYPAGQLTSADAKPFLTPTETSFSFSMTPHRHSIIQIDAAFLEQIATERHSGAAQRVVFDYASEPTTKALASWRDTVASATGLVVSESTPPLARHAAQTSIVRSLLDLFPWRPVDVPDAIRTERTSRLRQAAEYVHAKADEPVTTAEIAAAAGLHTRTLQMLMQEHLGCSPTNYVRNVRLDRARQDLLSADPGSVRVADIARTWGFGHLGRFAAAYTERFGEYPRATLNS